MAAIRTAHVTLTGTTGLLLHANNPDAEAATKRWRSDPAHKALSVPGDDRSPAWTWHACYYHDGAHLGIPSDNLMTMLREGGAKVPTGKRGGTMKRATQSGLIVMEPLWALYPAGRAAPVEVAPLLAVAALNDWEAQQAAARAAGFELLLKGVRVGQARHLRVRPLFAQGWRVQGTISVVDDAITNEAFQNVLTYGGMYAGLGDWRPSSPKCPGPYGQFTAEIAWAK